MIPDSENIELFQRITDSAKAICYSQSPLLEIADSQLFFSSDGLTCFARVDASCKLKERQASGRSYFLSPSTFIWKLGCDISFTSITVDAEHRSFLSLLNLHAGAIRLFVKLDIEENWLDMGICQKQTLSGRLDGTLEVIEIVNFHLSTQMPEPIWLLVGGHTGWWLSINGVDCEASSADEVLREIRDAWARVPVDVEISRYAGDTLFAVADGKGWATVNYFNGCDEKVSRAVQTLQWDEPTYIFTRSDGCEYDIPVDRVIQHGEALSLIEVFVLYGSTAGFSTLG